MKVEATVGQITVSVEGSVVSIGNVGKEGTVTFNATDHREVSKTITKLIRVSQPQTPSVKVEGEKVEGKKDKGKKKTAPAPAPAEPAAGQ